MPLYRYKCNQCKEEFTALTALGKESEIRCKKCGNSKVEKLLPRFFTGRTAGKALAGTGGCSTCSAPTCRSCKG
jgi:putative FmdB family regulatory protein